MLLSEIYHYPVGSPHDKEWVDHWSKRENITDPSSRHVGLHKHPLTDEERNWPLPEWRKKKINELVEWNHNTPLSPAQQRMIDAIASGDYELASKIAVQRREIPEPYWPGQPFHDTFRDYLIQHAVTDERLKELEVKNKTWKHEQSIVAGDKQRYQNELKDIEQKTTLFANHLGLSVANFVDAVNRKDRTVLKGLYQRAIDMIDRKAEITKTL